MPEFIFFDSETDTESVPFSKLSEICAHIEGSRSKKGVVYQDMEPILEYSHNEGTYYWLAYN